MKKKSNNKTRNKTNLLADNPHIQEAFSILKENDKDTAGLTALLSYMKQMEDFVKSAESQIVAMKTQLDEIKEIQNHPIKSVLNTTTNSIERNIKNIITQLNKVRATLIETCKKIVTGAKETGIIALDKLTSFFDIKQSFEAIVKSTTTGMANCDKAVAKIETFSREYHATGLHFKNMFRMAVGKEPRATPEDIGKLAKSMCSPYKRERNALNAICTRANDAIRKIETLSKNANEIRQGREANHKESTAQRIAKLEQKSKQSQAQAPTNIIDINIKRKTQENSL